MNINIYMNININIQFYFFPTYINNEMVRKIL